MGFDLPEALGARNHPTITYWNRLEGRPRTTDFTGALAAELSDPLWMLTRQWQLGEFRGEDAGSPAEATVHLSCLPLQSYRAGEGSPVPYDAGMPLEARAWARPVAWTVGGVEVGLDLRLAMGRQWLRLLAPLGDFRAAFAARYPVHLPDPDRPSDAAYCADPEVWGTFAAAHRRLPDGARLYRYLTEDPTRHAYDGIGALVPHASTVDELAEKYLRWCTELVRQPSTSDDSWRPDRLDYHFEVATAEGGYTVREHTAGRLDWFHLDPQEPTAAPDHADRAAPDQAAQIVTRTVRPLRSPRARWWSFADGRANLAALRPDSTDLGALFLVDHAINEDDGWLLLPVRLPAGTVNRVSGVAVRTVFGEQTWIAPDSEANNVAPDGVDAGLVLLPGAADVQHGPPMEAVALAFDEVAGLVWAVEGTVTLPTGEPAPGAEVAARVRAHLAAGATHPRATGPAPGATQPRATGPAPSAVRYRVVSDLPEHWIPFVRVRLPGDTRATRLQRARLPLATPAGRVTPRTQLLREGLDRTPREPYFLTEDEVPPRGVEVIRGYQRTRGPDGRVWLWQGMRKRAGRPEEAIPVAFDLITGAGTGVAAAGPGAPW